MQIPYERAYTDLKESLIAEQHRPIWTMLNNPKKVRILNFAGSPKRVFAKTVAHIGNIKTCTPIMAISNLMLVVNNFGSKMLL